MPRIRSDLSAIRISEPKGIANPGVLAIAAAVSESRRLQSCTRRAGPIRVGAVFESLQRCTRRAPTMPAFQGSYTGTREQQALAWVEQVTGMTFDGDELGMALHNGVALAELANRLVPGTVQKISHSRMPFPQRENIAAFIEAARVMGVPDHVLFSTGDLYEQANLKQVVECLHALGEVVYSLADYDGPALGAPPAQRATRHDSASAGRKIQGERSAALEAFHQLDASDDELAALKALKADYSAQTAASIAAADYASYSADDFDVHSELAAVKAEVAALREHLDVSHSSHSARACLCSHQLTADGQPDRVRCVHAVAAAQVNESTAWSAGEAQPEPIPPRPPPASAAAVPAAAAAGGRPRQQSATMAHRDRSRSRSMSSSRLSAPPPVIVEEHIPHSVVRAYPFSPFQAQQTATRFFGSVGVGRGAHGSGGGGHCSSSQTPALRRTAPHPPRSCGCLCCRAHVDLSADLTCDA